MTRATSERCTGDRSVALNVGKYVARLPFRPKHTCNCTTHKTPRNVGTLSPTVSPRSHTRLSHTRDGSIGDVVCMRSTPVGVARRRAVSERSVTHIRTRHTCCANALSPSPEARSSLVVDALTQHIRSRPSPQRQPPARCPPALPSVLDFPRPTPAHVNHSGFTAIAHSRHKYRWQVASPTCLHPEIRLKPRPHTARVARLLHIHNPRAEGPSQ